VSATPVTNIEQEKLEGTCGQGDGAPQPEANIPNPPATKDEDNTNAKVGQTTLGANPAVAEDSTIASANLVNPNSSPIEEAEDDEDWRMAEDVDLASEKIPDFIEQLNVGSDRYLLPGESDDEFMSMFFDLERHFKIKNVMEYWILFDLTTLLWEIFRYRRMKIGIIRNHQRAAVESLFRKTHNGRVPPNAVEDYFSDPVFRAETCKAFEEVGFSPDAVEVEAFQRSLAPIAEIERLIASAQKRVAAFTKDLEKRYADRGARVRAAAAWKAFMGD
jgi:hypothetical protein